MFNNIIKQLNEVCTVISVFEENDSLNAEFNRELTSTERNNVNIILQSWPLEKAKNLKILLLDLAWKEKLKQGWETPDGYSLGIDISDITLLNGAFTLAKEASLIGINDPVSIVDIDGQSHSMNLEDLTLLMLQYGQARSLLSNLYASTKQSINNASSLEELEAININI